MPNSQISSPSPTLSPDVPQQTVPQAAQQQAPQTAQQTAPQTDKPQQAFWRGASQRMRDPFYPHRARKGRGRGPLRRLAALVGIVGIVLLLGSLLFGAVVLAIVLGSFFMETIIG